MTNFRHLTQFELAAYQNHSLEVTQLREIGRHLLMCPDCRQRLPLPTVEQFWSAILTDNERDEKLREETAISTRTIFPFFPTLSSNLLWGGAALLLLFALSIVMWLGLAGQSNPERRVADVFDSEVYTMGPDKLREQIIPPPMVLPSGRDSTAKSGSNRESAANNRTVPESNQRQEGARLPLQKNPEPQASRRNPVVNKKVISATRGAADEKCSGGASVVMETGTNTETVRLRWRKIPNAVKYHLYVSDDNEILVDEYETERENVYELKKPLDPAKTYKWKIIITLENGQTIVGDAQKFTVKDLHSDQEIIKRQKRSQMRCSEGN